MTKLRIREATKYDQDQIVALIDSVYGEYGDSVCLEGADQDLTDLEGHYLKRQGKFWVLVDEGDSVKATHAAIGVEDDVQVCTFRRLYLTRELRGGEWGVKLMELTIDWARKNEFRRVEFWSDTRFERAHRFFEKFGFQDTGGRREMLDGQVPYSERHFCLEL